MIDTQAIIEEEALEAPPLGIFGPGGMMDQSCPENPDYDTWGNIRLQAEKVIEENHGQNFIKILIYQYNKEYFYGFQIRIEKLIRQKKANISDLPLGSTEAAREAAREQIIELCKMGHAIKKAYNDFTVIRYNQLELF
jgi:hypothetical protein